MGLMFITASAVPADPTPQQVSQPDGSKLTVVLHGDEFFNYLTTIDGYTVVKNEAGYYTYAQLDGNRLVASGCVARDEKSRSAADRTVLAKLPKRLTSNAMVENGTKMLKHRNGLLRGVGAGGHMDYSKFRGLIILINYTDRKFEDYVPSNYEVNDFYDQMVNTHDYNGYTLASGYKVDMMGSVRAYYYDNSFQQFDPSFDILGPVDVDFACTDAHQMSNCTPIFYSALEALDGEVDFSQYDTDGDGTVDMVCFLVAGYGSDYSSNNRDYLWPHMYNLEDSPVLDGVNFSLYACSTGMNGAEPEYGINRTTIAGIGTFCHEFSHVLGLPDLYDTDYEGGGGQSSHPAEWAIMAGGGYLNYGRTPAGYTLYERYALGFASPQLISDEGDYSLLPIGDANQGYRLNTPVKKEFFLIENRQKTSKWDEYLPGHGMLVFRVDSTNSNPWQRNEVNNNPKHNYFTLLRAGGASGEQARPSDPFPGTTRTTMLNNDTEPANLLTWSGRRTLLGMENIAEQGDIVSFSIINTNVLKTISLPQNITLSNSLTMQLTTTRYPETAPCTLTWQSSNEKVVTVASNGRITAIGPGEADIIAVANNDEAISATCHVNVVDDTIANTIAEYCALPAESEAALLLNNALVVFSTASTAYLRDATAAIAIDNSALALEVGDRLNGHVYGKLTTSGFTPQLSKVEGRTSDMGFNMTKHHAVVPVKTSADKVDEHLYGDLITLEAVMMQNDGGLWVIGENNRIRLYNTFKLKGISVPKSYVGKYFDVTGIYVTNKLADGTTFNELALTQSPTEVDAPSGITAATAYSHEPAQVFTTDGRLVAQTTADAIMQLPLRRGIYVVKTASRAWRIAR